jgi:hypothetical protein
MVGLVVLVLADNLCGYGPVGALFRGGSQNRAPLDDKERQSPYRPVRLSQSKDAEGWWQTERTMRSAPRRYTKWVKLVGLNTSQFLRSPSAAKR